MARTFWLPNKQRVETQGRVVVITAGTSDLPVAREAVVTATALGADTHLLADVGVAGIHRLLRHHEEFQGADAIVVVAGMDGALPSVVGGLVSCPVIAVPTSVGYGAAFGGLAPLLTMLNACSANVVVVNIDSGFKGGYVAAADLQYVSKGSDPTEFKGSDPFLTRLQNEGITWQVKRPANPPRHFSSSTPSVPDGKLLSQVKYAADNLAPEEAIARAQAEARAASPTNSDFLPVTFQIPIAVCVSRVGTDYALQNLACLDAPQFRPRKIVESFWAGVATYRAKYRDRIKLVTFNGRGFDLPLLELAAFRYGVCGKEHFVSSRKRFDGWHLDLMDWLCNFGGYRMVGGLNLLSKVARQAGKNGRPGRHGLSTVSGRQTAGDQRLLPVRYAGYLLRLSAPLRPHGGNHVGAGTRRSDESQGLGATKDRRNAGAEPLPR